MSKVSSYRLTSRLIKPKRGNLVYNSKDSMLSHLVISLSQSLSKQNVILNQSGVEKVWKMAIRLNELISRTLNLLWLTFKNGFTLAKM